MLGAYIFIIVISLSWIDPLISMYYFSLSLFTAFVLKSVLSDMSIVTPAFFWSLFEWNMIFQSFTFSLYVSLVLRWVLVDNIQGSCFYIHSASLCLLVGAFNRFMFKVITDKYDPVAIYFTVLGWGLYNHLCFLSRDYPLEFVGDLVSVHFSSIQSLSHVRLFATP